MFRRTLGTLASAIIVGSLFLSVTVFAADDDADAFIKRLSSDVMDKIRLDKTIKSGDMTKLMVLVDGNIMPNVDFIRMTASSVGPSWRQATPEQKKTLQDEFKILLIRTYSGALAKIDEQSIRIKPLRDASSSNDAVVRTEFISGGEPIQIDYRLEKIGASWKIYDLNVLGMWLVSTYRSQFAREINAGGIDGLIASLTSRNKKNMSNKSTK